ncbi:hypothetical protein LBMAG42_00010 [Deltaproteobacteria bacterium]|nr:hypothetical protein LBMAG42_00010 [Deltaproteobacteria bacterium]
MADSGDDCEEVTGSGCSLLVSEPKVGCLEPRRRGEDEEEDSGDFVLHGTGLGSGPDGTPAECGCAHASAPGLIPLFVFCFVWVRRLALTWLVLIAASIRPARAEGIDADLFTPGDGGPALSVVEAELGERWSFAAAGTWALATNPVVARTTHGEQVLLEGVATGTVGGSVRIADGPRVGAALRYHSWSFLGEPGEGLGDTTLWASVPLYEGRAPGLFGALTVGIVLPTGPKGVFLSDESGAVDGLISARWSLAGIATDVQLGGRLQRDQDLGGSAWGSRYRWAVAVSARPAGWGLLSAEVYGSGPFSFDGNIRAVTPVEVALSAGVCHRWGWCARVGGGGGISYGLGSPALRTLAVLEWRRPTRADRDADGLVDVRDRCVDVPEDFDLIQDEDGCPEEDADGDEIRDGADLCPNVPERANGFADEDGCPDAAVVVHLTVRGQADVATETAIVEGLSREAYTVLFGEDSEVRVALGSHTFTVEAEGYVPWTGVVDAVGDEVWVVADIMPIRFGTAHLGLFDPAGAPLSGYARRPAPSGRLGPVEEIGREGRDFALTLGPETWTVYAPGFAPRAVPFVVPANATVTVNITLTPVDLRIEGDRITTTRVLSFELNKADLRPEGLPVVDDIVSLLELRPDIRLLRVEGHADETGSSQHNLDLSRARAAAVVEALVARGVAAERLEAIGSGEAREAADTRTVDFTVLVWDDD